MLTIPATDQLAAQRDADRRARAEHTRLAARAPAHSQARRRMLRLAAWALTRVASWAQRTSRRLDRRACTRPIGRATAN